MPRRSSAQTRTRLRLSLLPAFLAALAATALAQAPPRTDAAARRDRPAPGIEELARLDHLPRLRQSVEVGMVSSYDRTAATTTASAGSSRSSGRSRPAWCSRTSRGPA